MATSQTAGSAVNPQVPAANLGNLYLNGQRLLWLSTTTFSVGAGMSRDSTDTVDIIMGGNQYSSTSNPGAEQGLNSPFGSGNVSSAVTVSISSVWSSTQAGLDVGTVAASTMYSVFTIGDSRGFNPGSALVSLVAPTATPHLPLGYDSYRYVGSISVDGSSHVRKFMQSGAQALRTMWYDPGTGPSTRGVVIPSSPTTGSASYVNVGVLTTLVPQAQLECLFDVDIIGSSAGDALWMAPATIDNGTTATVGSFTGVSTVAGTYHELAQLRCPVSLPNATQVAALTISATAVTALVATTTTDAIVILFSGYVDQL